MTNFIFGVDNGGKIGSEQNKSFLVGIFFQNPKKWKKIVEFQKIKTNHHHRGHAPFSKCPVNSRSKRKTFYKVVSLITLEELAGDANHYSIGDNGFYQGLSETITSFSNWWFRSQTTSQSVFSNWWFRSQTTSQSMFTTVNSLLLKKNLNHVLMGT